MHPLLGHGRRLALYFSVWVPLGVLIGYLVHSGGGVSGAQAAELAAPLAFLYAFICLSSWYLCRVWPMRGGLDSVVGVQLTAGLLAASLWATVMLLLAAAFGVRVAAGVKGLVGGVGFLLYLLTVAGYYLWIGAETARRAEVLAREAELRALKAQLNPHFLFNSLNSISALTATDPARAREMCVLLGDFLRRTLRLGERREVPLADELDLTRAYLAVEQIRFGPRLRFEENIAPGALATEVPPLLLQPLVENAVVHGVAQLLDGGWIRLDAVWSGDGLRLCVCNPYDPEALDVLSPRPGSGGLGIANVRNRLEARFGAAARLETAAADGQYSVTITLPQEVPA